MTLAKIHQPTEPAALVAYRAKLDQMSDEQLRAEFVKELGLTVEKLVRLAAIWARIERRGLDTSNIKDGRTFFLPHIEAGVVLPDLVVAFSGKPAHLKILATLTPDVQRRAVDGEGFMLMEKRGATYEGRSLPVQVMTLKQLVQLIGERAIRTETEQIALLLQPPVPRKPGRPIKRGNFVADATTNKVRIGRSSASAADAIEAMRVAGMIPG